MNDLLKNKWVMAVIMAVIIALTIITFALNLSDNDSTEIQVDRQTTAENEVAPSDMGSPEEETVPQESYYFVKEDAGVVNIYQYNGNQKVLYMETSIAFSLLSAEDQELLKTGVQLKDEQELANFLENFDS